jgi:hypothetical protein
MAAIAKIGDLAPEKRMWHDLMDAKQENPPGAATLMQDAQRAFADWSDGTSLPEGVKADPDADCRSKGETSGLNKVETSSGGVRRACHFFSPTSCCIAATRQGFPSARLPARP